MIASIRRARRVRFFSFPYCGEMGKTSRDWRNRESKAKRRWFWKSPSVFDGGDSAVRDVEQCSLFTEKRQQMGSSLEHPGWHARLGGKVRRALLATRHAVLYECGWGSPVSHSVALEGVIVMQWIRACQSSHSSSVCGVSPLGTLWCQASGMEWVFPPSGETQALKTPRISILGLATEGLLGKWYWGTKVVSKPSPPS